MGRGSHGVRGLVRCFLRADKNNNNFLDRHEFSWALKENGHALTKTELDKLFRYFDKNGDDQVSYNCFMEAIRPAMSQCRTDCVKGVFAKLDADGRGVVCKKAMCDAYNAGAHPRVANGSSTAKEVAEEFKNQFDCCKTDGGVTLQEFVDYYTDVSCYMAND